MPLAPDNPASGPALAAAVPARVRSALPVIALVCFLFVLPMAMLGYGPTHDFGFHVGNWMEVAQQWRDGILVPRWAAQANYGYGDPRFIFYPPLSWMGGASLSFLFPWRMVPAVFVFLALITAGTSMFLLARDWLPKPYAVLAAIFYVVNPYEVMLIYKRMAAAELLASAIFPLLLLFGLRVGGFDLAAILPLAAVYAGMWLTNAPGAVIASYSVALLLVAMAAHSRSLRPLLYGGAALALGLALAGCYIVLAGWEQRWVDISYALTLAHNRPENNFIRMLPPRLPGGIASIVTVGFVNLVLAAVVWGVAIHRRRKLPPWWWAVGLVGALAAAMTLPVSLPAWHHLPKLLFVQLPWRWLFVVNAVSAFVLAAVLPSLRPRARAIAAAVPIVLFLGLLGTYATKGRPGEVLALKQRIAAEGGYRGEAAYLPRGEYREAAGRDRTMNLPGVRVLEHTAEHLRFESNAGRPTVVRLDLAWYPAWRATIEGASVRVMNEGGQVAVEVPSGRAEVDVRFARTPDRLLGGAISLSALVMFAGGFVFRRKTRVVSEVEVAEEQPV